MVIACTRKGCSDNSVCKPGSGDGVLRKGGSGDDMLRMGGSGDSTLRMGGSGEICEFFSWPEECHVKDKCLNFVHCQGWLLVLITMLGKGVQDWLHNEVCWDTCSAPPSHVAVWWSSLALLAVIPVLCSAHGWFVFDECVSNDQYLASSITLLLLPSAEFRHCFIIFS